MKSLLITLLFITVPVAAQYSIRSSYLKNPESIIPYVDSCAVFWLKTYDPSSGGYFTNVDRAGAELTSWGVVRNSLNQSRDAYGFVRAFMLTGNKDYLLAAHRALTFMYHAAWDTVYGGWYKEINSTGKPTHPTDNKTAFYQHYAMLGIMASYEATRDSIDWSWLTKSYTYNEQTFWDTSSQYFGYFDNIKYDGTNPSGKTFNSTVDAMTTHVLHLYLMTQDSIYKNRLLQLADNMKNRLAESANHQAIGFAESYDTQWNPLSSTDDQNRTIMGHVLKTAWCLARMYQLFPDTTYLSTAESLAHMVWDKGYDHEYGGPYKDYVRQTGVMMMYGQDTAKAWWQMEQAVTAGLMLYQITKKEMYLQMADETLDFFMKYFVDHTYGDVYSDLTKKGANITAWGGGYFKGNDGKAGYHSIETGYYVYLYSKLLLHHDPATLYYKIDSAGYTRNFLMNPIANSEGIIRIKGITLDNNLYSNFKENILTVPAGTGGVFAVTYENTTPLEIAKSSQVFPKEYLLSQNFPNPFNPTTHIQYSIPASGFVTLKVYDALGREVTTLVNEQKNAGRFSAEFNASSLSSGMYFYRMTTGSYSETRKMIFLK